MTMLCTVPAPARSSRRTPTFRLLARQMAARRPSPWSTGLAPTWCWWISGFRGW